MQGTGLVGSPVVRLLLVEDSEADAFLVREILRETGVPFEVTWARTLAEVRGTPRSAVDVVLLDLGLPDAHGMTALHEVRLALPGAAVLVLTGHADESLGIEAVTAGAQDYLVKGRVDGPLLTRSIRYAVERGRAEVQLRRLYESELRAAENARLERGLLPHPEVLDERVRVRSRYRPGRDAVLGGDFFDVVETPEGLHAVIGDVSGHGPDEAALGVALRIAWRTLVLSGADPERVLPVLEDVLVRERRHEEVFATVCQVVVRGGTALLHLAGHPAPLLLAESPVQLPDQLAGPPLGVLPGVVWGHLAVELGEQWRLLLFTDGLVEGRIGPGRDRLGIDGLLGLARASRHYGDAEQLAGELVARARELHGEDLPDDVAVLAVERS